MVRDVVSMLMNSLLFENREKLFFVVLNDFMDHSD